MGDVADEPQEGPDDSSKLSPFEQKIATVKAPDEEKTLLDDFFGEIKNTCKEAES